MRLLLDTHAFLWMHGEPRRLSPAARKHLIDASTQLFLSIGSVWELGIKIEKKKLALPEALETYVLSRVAASRITLVPIQLGHVVDAAQLPRHHADPFDRLLIAQARCDDLTVATADPIFARYDVSVLVAGG